MEWSSGTTRSVFKAEQPQLAIPMITVYHDTIKIVIFAVITAKKSSDRLMYEIKTYGTPPVFKNFFFFVFKRNIQK